MLVKQSYNLNDSYTSFEKKINSPETGAFYLVGRAILNCFSKPVISPYKDYNEEIEKIFKQRINFAWGKLCQSWCDLSGYNHQKVAEAILKHNTKNLYNCLD